MKIINLTQHPASAEQRQAGVIDLDGDQLAALRQLLTFEELPTARDILGRAARIAQLGAATGAEAAMIGGAPYLMADLEAALGGIGIQPIYAFSRRESAEKVLPDGSTTKVAVFRHLGFVISGQEVEGRKQ